MTKIFYDHLVFLEEIEVEIKNISRSPDEKEELWKLVDDIVNHRVMINILDRLPIEHHEDFLLSFHDKPYDEGHIHFLNERIASSPGEGDVENIIKSEIESLKQDLLQEIKSLKG